MIAVGYFDGINRRGLLVWTQDSEGIYAIGGFDPGDVSKATEPVTVITTDAGSRQLQSWVHPDDIAEVSGKDSPNLISADEWVFA